MAASCWYLTRWCWDCWYCHHFCTTPFHHGVPPSQIPSAKHSKSSRGVGCATQTLGKLFDFNGHLPFGNFWFLFFFLFLFLGNKHSRKYKHRHFYVRRLRVVFKRRKASLPSFVLCACSCLCNAWMGPRKKLCFKKYYNHIIHVCFVVFFVSGMDYIWSSRCSHWP